MADFVDQKKGEIEARIKELRPLVEEYDRLNASVFQVDILLQGGALVSPSKRGLPLYPRADSPH